MTTRIIADSLGDVIERTGNPRTGFDPRASGGGQLSRGSQQRQLTAGRQAIAAVGGKLVYLHHNDRPQPGRLSAGRLASLERAFAMCARLNAHYTTFNVGRLIRADDSHGQHAPFVLPSAEEIDVVLRMAERWGVIVATIDPPDLDGRTIRSRDTKRGMALGGRPGPPRSIDTLSRRTVQTIIGLHVAGESRRGIARVVDLPESTVRAVLSRAQKEG